MNVNNVLTLLDYNYWATERVLTAAAHLSDAQFVASTGFSLGSLRDILVHMLSAEWIWRMRCQEGISPIALLAREDYATLDSVRNRWQAEERAMRDYLRQLSDGDLDQTVSYRRTGGVPMEDTLWHLLLHLINHSTQHRSEAAVLLTECGHSPGDLDLIAFFRKR